jgi:hypothetical protein
MHHLKIFLAREQKKFMVMEKERRKEAEFDQCTLHIHMETPH